MVAKSMSSHAPLVSVAAPIQLCLGGDVAFKFVYHGRQKVVRKQQVAFCYK